MPRGKLEFCARGHSYGADPYVRGNGKRSCRTCRAASHARNYEATKELADHYQDTGCDLAPACLTCPLPLCIHDAVDQGLSGMAYRHGISDIRLLRRYEGLLTKSLGPIYTVLRELALTEEQTPRGVSRRLENGRWWELRLDWDGVTK